MKGGQWDKQRGTWVTTRGGEGQRKGLHDLEKTKPNGYEEERGKNKGGSGVLSVGDTN